MAHGSCRREPVGAYSAAMTTLELYFATNRKHQGDDRWHPTGYGTTFSDDACGLALT